MPKQRSTQRSKVQKKYDEKIAERMNKYGIDRFNVKKEQIRLLLGKYFQRKVVLVIAKRIATKYAYTLDMCSSRKFNALLLWIFEHYEDIGKAFEENISAFVHSQEGSQVDERSKEAPGIGMNEPDKNSPDPFSLVQIFIDPLDPDQYPFLPFNK